MRRLAVVALAALSCTAAQAQVFVVHAVERSCSSIDQLDSAMSSGDLGFFKGWGDQDFLNAIAWARGCPDSGWQFARKDRVERLDIRRRKLLQDQQIAARNAEIEERNKAARDAVAAERAKVVAQNLQHAQEISDIQEALNKHDACEATPAGQKFKLQEAVINDLEAIDAVKSDQARERKISAVSGVQNLSRAYENGSDLVDLDAALRADFEAYRRAGGQAKSPRLVRHTASDPC